MTSTRSKAKPDDEALADEQAAGQTAKAEPQPLCGKPHHLPMLAGHVACQLDAEELELGELEHEHRHEDGDAVYVWR